MDDPGADSPTDLALAQFVYAAQAQQMDRSAVTAQGLLTALALLAAFSAPLVVADPPDGWLGTLAIISLIGCSALIAVAAYWTLRVVYVGRNAQVAIATASPSPGFLYFADILAFKSPSEFSDHCALLSDDAQIRHLYAQSWQLAHLVSRKATSTVLAVRWTLGALLAFLLTLVIRYAGTAF